MSRAQHKPFVIKIDRDLWETCESAAINDFLIETLMADQASLRRYRGAVELVWGNLPKSGKPAWLVPVLAQTIRELDEKWPLALYFFDRNGKSLEAFQYSVGQAQIVRDGEKFVLTHDQALVSDHLASVWVPALGKVCQMAGLGQREFDESYRSALQYFGSGPRL